MADEFHTGLCSTMNWWNTMRTPTSFDFPLPPPISCTTESVSWSTTQPFLPVELNQIQTGFGDSSMSDQTLLPELFEPAPVDMTNDPVALQPAASWPNFSNSPHHHHQLSTGFSPSKQQLNFSNNAPFWNPAAPVKLPEPRFEDESSGSNLIAMKSTETKRRGSTDQPAVKKPRIAMPSPLPTFKVRKEKLGDRITALQQLVSPFGKTDTASVLHEAIEYIKFLHGQVGALSTPYLKNGHQMRHQMSMESSKGEGVQDLRSRGLCLVPISSTFAVASETPMEFWAPTFLGSYR